MASRDRCLYLDLETDEDMKETEEYRRSVRDFGTWWHCWHLFFFLFLICTGFLLFLLCPTWSMGPLVPFVVGVTGLIITCPSSFRRYRKLNTSYREYILTALLITNAVGISTACIGWSMGTRLDHSSYCYPGLEMFTLSLLPPIVIYLLLLIVTGFSAVLADRDNLRRTIDYVELPSSLPTTN
ncbi:hypothetical protein SNE40_017345 [Patella caerulea]|uniref:Transmembrane protein n=1 Tax=Patella caerulea TaxID=87958 RepID=A0AAN8P9J4_PATCE